MYQVMGKGEIRMGRKQWNEDPVGPKCYRACPPLQCNLQNIYKQKIYTYVYTQVHKLLKPQTFKFV